MKDQVTQSKKHKMAVSDAIELQIKIPQCTFLINHAQQYTNDKSKGIRLKITT